MTEGFLFFLPIQFIFAVRQKDPPDLALSGSQNKNRTEPAVLRGGFRRR